jgi:hypothetical protein
MIVNTLGHQSTQPPTPTVAERMWQFLPAGFSVLSLSALVYYHLQLRHGPVQPTSALQYLYAGLYEALGLAPAVMFFLLVAVWSVIWSVRGVLERPLSKLVRLVAMTLMIGIWVNLGDGGLAPALHKGAIGAWFAEALHGSFGYWPSLLLVGAMTIASVMLATDFLFADLFEQIRADASRRTTELGVEPQVSEHLKGLASPPKPPSVPPPLRSEPAPVSSTNEDPSVAFAEAIAAAARAVADRDLDTDREPDTDRELPAAAEAAATDELRALRTEADEASPRPTTYEERRRMREARRWGRIQDDGWVPTSPESQEIDNAEAQVAAESAVARELASEGDEAAVEAERASSDAGTVAAGESTGEPAEQAADLPFGAAPWSPQEDDEPASSEVAAAEPAIPEQASDGIADAPWSTPATTREPAFELPLPEPAPSVYVEATAEPAAEPIVAIPRPEPVPVPAIAPVVRQADEPAAARQQSLFGDGLDQELVQEATDLVVGSRRASASFLQRKLRIDYPLAVELLAELAARGVVALEGDASQGRVLL